MFESFEKRPEQKSVVQPVLALVVHAGLISLALRGGPAPSLDRPADLGNDVIIFEYPIAVAGGPSASRGTEGTIPVSVPIDMTPDLQPLTRSTVTVPISRPGTFDPRRFVDFGNPDSARGLGGTILPESELTDPPRALHLAEPRYPEALRRAGIEGSVTVTYVVDPAGFVEPSSIRVVSSDQPAFAEAVVAAVGRAQFTPGRVHGRAVRVLVRQIIRFSTQS